MENNWLLAILGTLTLCQPKIDSKLANKQQVKENYILATYYIEAIQACREKFKDIRITLSTYQKKQSNYYGIALRWRLN